MGKKKRSKNRKKKQNPNYPAAEGFIWQDEKGQVHSLLPGPPPTPEKLEEMSKVYQEQIRKSPLWEIMVKEFGAEKAEELLKECRAELRYVLWGRKGFGLTPIVRRETASSNQSFNLTTAPSIS